MKEIDRKIADALRVEDAGAIGDVAPEPGIFETLLDAFQGRRRWLNLLGALWTVVFLVLGIASAVAFFRAGQTRDMLLWAASCSLCLIVVAMLKIWYWMELQRIALMREIKRLEIHVARVAARLGG